MPRELLVEEEIVSARADYKKRRDVLRDTVSRLDTEQKREEALNRARENHEHWKGNSRNPTISTKVSVIAGDWGCITAERSKMSGTIYAVLNMANAEIPGGSYLQGAAAQEENMFRRTDCHFYVTDEEMNSDKNRYTELMQQLINAEVGKVYLDTENPRVCIKGPETANAGGYDNLEPTDYFQFYELKSAADNLRVGDNEYLPFNEDSMRRKIAAQLDTLIEAGIRNVVLSAFGCGAFGNPASKVAQIYKEELARRPGHFDDVVFAIYNPGYGPDNFKEFQNILDNLELNPSVTREAKEDKLFEWFNDNLNTMSPIEKQKALTTVYKNLREGDLNLHENPIFDSLIGIANTASWQQTMDKIKDFSRKALFDDLSSCESTEQKLELLRYAKTLPLYKDHRSNFFFTGAWGRTNSVKMIDKEIGELEDIQSRQTI